MEYFWRVFKELACKSQNPNNLQREGDQGLEFTEIVVPPTPQPAQPAQLAQPQQPFKLHDLPERVLERIGKFLDWRTRHKLNRVCRKFNEVYQPELLRLKSFKVSYVTNGEYTRYVVRMHLYTGYFISFRICGTGELTEIMKAFDNQVDENSRRKYLCYSKMHEPQYVAAQIVEEHLQRYNFDVLDACLNDFSDLFIGFAGHPRNCTFYNNVNGLNMALHFQPIELGLRHNYRDESRIRTKFDFSLFPNLRRLHLYSTSHFVFIELLQSTVDTCIAHCNQADFAIDDVELLAKMFESDETRCLNIFIKKYVNWSNHHKGPFITERNVVNKKTGQVATIKAWDHQLFFSTEEFRSQPEEQLTIRDIFSDTYFTFEDAEIS